ncbi:MAG: hypothetical protein V4550_03755 [Gemmatimonadota bacterium]
MRALRFVRQVALLSIVSAVAVAATPSRLSDPVGIYALIDKVVVSANEETVQIWGVFALSTGMGGDSYKPVQRGYMFFKAASDPRVSRAEWNDFQSVAGSGQVVGFGQRYTPTGRVRSASEPLTAPEPYPIGFGVRKTTNNPLASSIQRDLASIPLPLSPLDGSTVKSGPVRFVVRNVKDTLVRYVFSLDGKGQHETSEPLPAGKDETSWTPKLALRPGEDYIWRVVARSGNWTGQPVESSIRVAK